MDGSSTPRLGPSAWPSFIERLALLRDTAPVMPEESTTPDLIEISRMIFEADGYEE